MSEMMNCKCGRRHGIAFGGVPDDLRFEVMEAVGFRIKVRVRNDDFVKVFLYDKGGSGISEHCILTCEVCRSKLSAPIKQNIRI